MKEKGLALVTGASSGVGREIALILASKGWNLILVARSQEKLIKLQSELIENYKVQADYFCADLSKTTAPAEIKAFCDSKNYVVDLLVNNAGAGLFGESVELGDKVVAMLNLNDVCLTQMCAIFGKQMKDRKHGSILNIGSLAGNQPTAYFASYAASKSYVLFYSVALRHELGRYGVNVTCVQPGYIRTDFDNNCNIKSEKYKKFSYKNGMTARAVAECAVRSVLHKRSYVRAGFGNKVAGFFSGLIPKNFLAWVLSKSIRSLNKDTNR